METKFGLSFNLQKSYCKCATAEFETGVAIVLHGHSILPAVCLASFASSPACGPQGAGREANQTATIKGAVHQKLKKRARDEFDAPSKEKYCHRNQSRRRRVLQRPWPFPMLSPAARKRSHGPPRRGHERRCYAHFLRLERPMFGQGNRLWQPFLQHPLVDGCFKRSS